MIHLHAQEVKADRHLASGFEKAGPHLRTEDATLPWRACPRRKSLEVQGLIIEVAT